MMREYANIEAWANDVRRGEIVLAAGSRLSFEQMAALGMRCDLAGDARTGAPGSRASQDAMSHERKLTLAAQALQRERDVSAAASCSGTPQERIQATLEGQMRTGNAWERLEHQRQHHVSRNAGLSPEHGVHAALERQRLPTVTAERTIGQSLAKRVLQQFEEAEIRPGQDRTAAMDTALAAIRQRLDKVEKLLHRWLGDTAHPDLVTKPLAMTRQIRTLLAAV